MKKCRSFHNNIKEAPDAMACEIEDNRYNSSNIAVGNVRVTERKQGDGMVHREDNMAATTLGVH